VTFRNIRYAAAPLGSLRFNAATSPPVNRTVVQNASDVICPQAYPSWLLTSAVTPVDPTDIPPVDPRTSEDCLFLDVLLPQGIWSNRHTSRAPVLVWIHGGGFVVGYKDASGAGYGLVSRSELYGRSGVILVSVNYSLGLFVSVVCVPEGDHAVDQVRDG
jgi:carboxylesterase type B